MSIPLYLDHNVDHDLLAPLRHRDIDVVTARDDGATRLEDERLLACASALGRVLVTTDHDFLAITTRWSRAGREFAGLVFFPQQGMPFRQVTDELLLVAELETPASMLNRVVYLPLQ